MIEAHGMLGREGQPPELAPDDAPETAPDRAPDPAPDPATPQESPTDAAEQALCAAREGFNTQDQTAAEPGATPAPASTALRLLRKSALDLHPLTEAIAVCLHDNPEGRDPRQIAREVLAAGRLALVEYELRRSLRTDKFRKRDQDDQRRMARNLDRYDRLERKLGLAKAGQAVLDLWDKPLTYRDRQTRTQSLPKLRRAAVVTNALVNTLSEWLGRPLRFSLSPTGGPDVRALVTAWTILHGDRDDAEAVKDDPDAVQRPGSKGWFISAIRQQRRDKLPQDSKSSRNKAEESDDKQSI